MSFSIRNTPIRVQLALWYAGSMALALVAVTFLFHVWFRTTLERDLEASLASSAAAVRGFFRTELREYESPAMAVAHLAGEIVFPDRKAQFLSPDGRVFAETRWTREPGDENAHEERRTVVRRLDPEFAPGWQLRIVGTTETIERPVARLDNLLLLGVPFGVLLAGAAGWWLVGRALRPVAEMAIATDRITATESSGRLPIANPTDELGRLGEHVNALLDRMDAALRQQRRFLADAAHELRTPVARMLAGVEFALTEQESVRSYRQALEHARDDLHRTSRLVDELLQIARTDAGGPSAQRGRAFLDDIVADAVGPWRRSAELAEVTLTLSTIDEAPADLDPILVERLIGILIDNAVRYTPPAGCVDVRVTRIDGCAALEVSDTGVGIPKEERLRIFERFYRGAAARRLRPDGSGLGLPIASWVAKQHGATLEVSDNASGGTRVRVIFPPAA